MRRLTRRVECLRHREKGLTLIELLIVVAILGIIAAVVIPNVSAFRMTGMLAAANDEASNVKTAAIAHYASEEVWPDTSGDLTDLNLLAGDLRAEYDFTPAGDSEKDGFIYSAEPDIEDGWGSGIRWDSAAQKWVRND